MATFRRVLLGAAFLAAFGMLAYDLRNTESAFAAQEDIPEAQKNKDKAPPVISDVRTESITETSAVVLWTTDEPADSAIRYGVDPRTNMKGPDDPALVLSHAIALSELQSGTTYAFCVESRDEANKKADACNTFTTPSLVTTSAGADSGGGPARPQITISGFAYPEANVNVVIKPIPFGEEVTEETKAAQDGSFLLSFEYVPFGFHTFLISAVDQNGVVSTRKGVQFNFQPGAAPLYTKEIIMSPTIALARTTIARGDNLVVSGSTIPNTGVLIEVGDVFYETKSGVDGMYQASINTARLASGKITVRARSAMISAFGSDYSQSKTATLSATSVPKADINADGVVDIQDFSMFLTRAVDMNNDGKINSADLSIFLRAFKLYVP